MRCIIALLLLLATPSQGRAEGNLTPIDYCNDTAPSAALLGCTALIETGQLEPGDLALAYTRRADALVALGAFEQAMRDRFQAFDLEPDDQDNKNWLSNAEFLRGYKLFAGGQFEEAVAHFYAAIVLNSENGEARDVLRKSLLLVGYEHLEEGRSDEAIAAFSEALVQGADEALVRRALGNTFFAVRNWTKAVQEFLELRKLRSISNDETLKLAKSFFALRRYGSASRELNMVLRTEPRNADALMLRALVSERTKRFDEALVAFQKVLSVEPGHTGANDGVKRLEKRENLLVRQIQAQLTRFGCNPGPIDGLWGRKSRAALQEFNQISDHREVFAHALVEREPTIQGLQSLAGMLQRISVATANAREVCTPPFVGIWSCSNNTSSILLNHRIIDLGSGVSTRTSYVRSGDGYKIIDRKYGYYALVVHGHSSMWLLYNYDANGNSISRVVECSVTSLDNYGDLVRE